MLDKPLVSVLMLAYNQEPYIRTAIECVLAQQTEYPFELVIGEDCSTDRTREIVLEYAEAHPNTIRVVTSAHNVGMHANSARTRSALRGKYVAYCEGDDFWHRSDKLELQVHYLENHPDCGLVCSDYNWLDEIGNQFVVDRQSTFKRVIGENPSIEEILRSDGSILTCTAVARRELVEEVVASDPFLHDSGHFKMSDVQLWAEIATRARVHRFSESLATYRSSYGSVSKDPDPRKSLRFRISSAEMRLYLCEKHDLSHGLAERYRAELRRRLFQLAFYDEDACAAHAARAMCPNVRMRMKDYIWYYASTKRVVGKILVPSLKLLRP